MTILKPEAKTRMLEFLEVDSFDWLIEHDELRLTDSVQDGFCMQCGDYFGRVEPDADEYPCESCGYPAVASLQMIVLFHT